MLIFIILALPLLAGLLFGLALVTDYRGHATRLSERNRQTVERSAAVYGAQGLDPSFFLWFGKSRQVGTVLMLLCAGGLALDAIGLIGAIADGT